MSDKFKSVPRKVCAAALLFCLTISLGFANFGFALSEIQITVDSSKVIGTNNFSLGFGLAGADVRIWKDRSTLRDLARQANFKIIRVYEHGLGKPCTYWDENTRTGTWDWTNIDELLRRIFEIGAEPYVLLGFYSWELGRLSSTPKGMLNDPVTGLPYPDQWGPYCAEWVRHFKQAGFAVRYYEIINEPHHYFGWPATQPKLDYYMKLFNAAAKAMRAVNPKVQLGCDQSMMKNVLNYFISNGENLDFFSYHTYATGDLSAMDSEILQAAETKYISETANVYGVDKAREVYKAKRGIDLPVIDSENNVNYCYSRGTDPRIQKVLGAVYNALVFRTFMLKNFVSNLYYCFATSASQEQLNPSGGAGFGMVNSDDNKPWYPYLVHKMLGQNLAVGDKLLETSSSSQDLRVIAWIHQEVLNVLLICKVDAARTVTFQGLTGQFNYSKIDNTISWKTPAVQTGTIDASKPIAMNGYTVMLLQGKASTISGFSDGFESGNFNKWTGTSAGSGDSTTVGTSQPHHGIYSARFTSDGAGSEYAYCYETISSSTELYVRGYFYVSRSGIVDNGDRFYFIVFRAGSNNVAYAGWRKTGGVVKWTLLIKSGTTSVVAYSTASPSLNRWYSIELHWKKDSTNGLGELWVDGTRVCAITGKNTAYYGNLSQVRFGLAALYYCGRTTTYGDCIKISSTYNGPENS